MPKLKLYDLFISHAWSYNQDYYRIEKMLNNADLFKWRNYSVPTHDPLIDPSSTTGRSKLTPLIDKQLRPVNCVIILAGMYAAHSAWILKEIEIAQVYDKPIIGVSPWGQINMPKAVRDSAIEIVGWNTSSIVRAIRENSI